jgi:hypothetical protein
VTRSRILGSLALAVAAAALGVASTSAGTLFTAYKPGLMVASHGIGFVITTPYGAAPTADVELFVPAGYGADLGQAIGAPIGTITAGILDRGAAAPFTGTVKVDDPNLPANACDVAGRDAIWTASLSNGKTSLSFAIYVRHPANQPTELHWCLPAGAPQLNTVAVAFTDVFSVPISGTLLWDARFTPYDRETGAVARGSRVSARALVRLPHVTVLHAGYSRGSHRYVLTGQVSEGGAPVDAEVELSVAVGSGSYLPIRHVHVRSDRNGNFTYSGRLSARHPVHFLAHVTAGLRTKQGCPPDSGNVPCVHSTLAPWEKFSNIATVRP